MARAVQFGAGNIGRGLVGYVLRRSGYDLTFVDVVDEVVRHLNALGRYPVRILISGGERLETIDNVHALHAADVEAVVGAVAGAQLVTTAVGAGVLPAVADPIREGLRRHPAAAINVIACENLLGNSTRLRALVEGEAGSTVPAWAGFPDCVVDRIVTGSNDPQQLAVTVEESFEFLVARGGWVGDVRRIEGVSCVEDLEPFRVRKLWLVNGLHAAVAYLGAHRGYRVIDEAMQDRVIRQIAEGAAAEAAAALRHRYPAFAREELSTYAGRSLARFRDPRLRDPIARVARDPLRKLGAGERLCGPARAGDVVRRNLVGAGHDGEEVLAGVAAATRGHEHDDGGANQGSQSHAQRVCSRATP